MLAGTQCTQIITEAAENGMKEDVKYLFQPSTCTPSSFVGKDKVGGDGSASNGWWVVYPGLKDFNSSDTDNDPWVLWGRDVLSKAGLNYKTSGSLGIGVEYGWPMTQVLQIAGQLDGGLTRANLITAIRAFDMTHPGFPPGIRFALSGGKDAYLSEAAQYRQYDSAKQQWTPQGPIIDLNGQSRLCAWDQSASACK
jgi:hypothetical protein